MMFPFYWHHFKRKEPPGQPVSLTLPNSPFISPSSVCPSGLKLWHILLLHEALALLIAPNCTFFWMGDFDMQQVTFLVFLGSALQFPKLALGDHSLKIIPKASSGKRKWQGADFYISCPHLVPFPSYSPNAHHPPPHPQQNYNFF